MFNPTEYFQNLVAINDYCVNQIVDFCLVSGLDGLEEMLAAGFDGNPKVCVDSSGDGVVAQERNGAYWIRLVYTVFILFPSDWGNRQSADLAMEHARYLMMQFMQRLIRDAKDLEKNLTYLNCERMPFRELDRSVAQHYVGLYFMIEMSEPLQLAYDPSYWIDATEEELRKH